MIFSSGPNAGSTHDWREIWVQTSCHIFSYSGRSTTTTDSRAGANAGDAADRVPRQHRASVLGS
jgi:hypothetical protein